MGFQLAPILAVDGERTVFVEHDVVAVFQLHQAQLVAVLHDALVLGFDLRLFEDL